MGKLLKGNAGAEWKQYLSKFLFGDETREIAQTLHDELIGTTGFGGFQASTAGITDPKKLRAMYAQEIAHIQELYQQQYQTVSVETLKGQVTRREIAPGVGELFEGVLRNLREEMQYISLTGTNIALQGRRGIAEQKAPELQEYKRLKDEMSQTGEKELSPLAQVDAWYQQQIQHLAELRQLSSRNVDLLMQMADEKRWAAFSDFLRQSVKQSEELAQRWERLTLDAAKLSAEFSSDKIKAGIEELKRQTDELKKLGDENAKLQAQSLQNQFQHRVRMIGLAPGASADPLGTLARQQAVERQEIQDRYNASLKTANETLTGAELVIAKSNIELQRRNELAQLNIQYEERAAEVRQKAVADFFAEMQGPVQTAGNIFYQAMHSGLTQISGELAKLMTGQKTSFAKMFEGIGDNMLKDTIKSGMQRGLGALGGLFGIHAGVGKPDGSSSNPFHVIWAGSQPGGLLGGGKSLPLPSAIGILGKIGGFFGGLFGKNNSGITSSDLAALSGPAVGPDLFGGFLAGGGDVDPGTSYVVGDGGEPEIFTPRSAGTVTPMSKLAGGDTHNWYIDARGAELGVENRIARTMETVHTSAVSTAVHTNVERAKRTPERKTA